MPSVRRRSFASKTGRSFFLPALLLSLGGCAEAGPWDFELTPIEPPEPLVDSSVGPTEDAAVDAAFGDDGSADGGTSIDAGPGCVPSGNADVPDDAFTDDDCDGVDGNASKLVFVATTGSDTAGAGTPESPFRTIGKGIAAAAARADGSGVAVSKGTYVEHVVLSNGVSVYGGYDATMMWHRSAANTTTIQQPSTSLQSGPNGFQYVEAVLATGITTATVLDRFTILAGDAAAAPATSGVSIYGIRVASSLSPTGTTGLRLRNLSVTAGKASNGANGTNGATGEDGVKGGDGQFPGNSPSNIGLGGVATCGTGSPVNSTRGGNGGMGGGDSLAGCGGAGDGTVGSAPFGDISCTGGSGGGGAGFCSFSAGGDGGPGSSMCGQLVEFLSADPPAAPTKSATVTGGLFVTTAGGTGSRGPHGSGGSGGGGSGADSTAAGYSVGASGSGGGSGGCGGYPGRGGQAGGASVALLVVDTNGLVVEASHFTSSAAGNGGRGGEGGGGGQGRLGGNFASSSQGAKSGVGGQGRAGGYGSPGGGGSGGSSVAQVLCNATEIMGVDNTTGTAGAAGTRGFGGSNGAGGPVGMNGTASALLQSCTIP